MKNTVRLITLCTLVLVLSSPAWAEEVTAATSKAVTAEMTPEAGGTATFQLASSVCQSWVPDCPPGDSRCAGKAPWSSCGNGGTCIEACDRLDWGTVCECWEFASFAEPEVKSLEQFLAELAPPASCKTRSESSLAD